MTNYIMRLLGFVLLSSTIINIIPNKNYKIYIKLFLGFVLVSTILSFVTGLTLPEFNINAKAKEINFKTLENKSNMLVLNEYNIKLKDKINEILYDYNYTAQNVEIKFSEDYKLLGLDIYLGRTNIYIEKIIIGGVSAPEVESMEIIEIKERISKLFNIDKGNINIYEND